MTSVISSKKTDTKRTFLLKAIIFRTVVVGNIRQRHRRLMGAESTVFNFFTFSDVINRALLQNENYLTLSVKYVIKILSFPFISHASRNYELLISKTFFEMLLTQRMFGSVFGHVK